MRGPSSIITPGTYRDLFTFQEKRTLYAAAKVNLDFQILLDDLAAVPMVDLTDPRISMALSLCVQASILTPERALDIINYRE